MQHGDNKLRVETQRSRACLRKVTGMGAVIMEYLECYHLEVLNFAQLWDINATKTSAWWDGRTKSSLFAGNKPIAVSCISLFYSL